MKQQVSSEAVISYICNPAFGARRDVHELVEVVADLVAARPTLLPLVEDGRSRVIHTRLRHRDVQVMGTLTHTHTHTHTHPHGDDNT